jgi:hypothetical protein
MAALVRQPVVVALGELTPAAVPPIGWAFTLAVTAGPDLLAPHLVVAAVAAAGADIVATVPENMDAGAARAVTGR